MNRFFPISHHIGEEQADSVTDSQFFRLAENHYIGRESDEKTLTISKNELKVFKRNFMGLHWFEL